MAKKSAIIISLLACLISQISADMSLDKVDREVLKHGLHRTLRTNVTYSTDLEADL